MISIDPNTTPEFIENVASKIYELSHQMGGDIAYSVIREVTENFIHAQFKEIVVSILDKGNTIRFADQGPGIQDKQRVQEPGITSAITPMKKYIRGVGSGLPIVKEYLSSSNGNITIEDNINCGSVVTISLNNSSQNNSHQTKPNPASSFISHINERQLQILQTIADGEFTKLSEIAQFLGTATGTTHRDLQKLSEYQLIEKRGHTYKITDFGIQTLTEL